MEYAQRGPGGASLDGPGDGCILVIVGLTGSLLAFREPINRLFNPGLYVDANGRQPLDLATLAERAEAQEPKMSIWKYTSEEHQALFHVFPRLDLVSNKPLAIDFDQLILDRIPARNWATT